MKTLLAAAVWLALAIVSSGLAAEAPAGTAIPHRWVYLATNLLVDKNVDDGVAILGAGRQGGLQRRGADRQQVHALGPLPERYLQNVRRFRQACRDLKLDCIACVCPIGYSNDLLSRDPNLAEGLPVKDAPFVAKDGRLVPADDSARLINGGFEQSSNNMPAGWSFVDQPGKITFIDTDVKYEGRCSLRMQDIGLHDPQHGHGRACQKIAVKPFRYYHVSAAVKTQDFESAGEVRIAVLAKDGTALNYYQPHVEKTQDWKRIDVTFNSLEFSEVNLYLGVWGGKRRHDLVGRRPHRAGRAGEPRPPRRRPAARHQRRRQDRVRRGHAISSPSAIRSWAWSPGPADSPPGTSRRW